MSIKSGSYLKEHFSSMNSVHDHCTRSTRVARICSEPQDTPDPWKFKIALKTHFAPT